MKDKDYNINPLNPAEKFDEMDKVRRYKASAYFSYIRAIALAKLTAINTDRAVKAGKFLPMDMKDMGKGDLADIVQECQLYLEETDYGIRHNRIKIMDMIHKIEASILEDEYDFVDARGIEREEDFNLIQGE